MKLRQFLNRRAALVGVAVCALVCAPAAFADMKAYNAAVKAGDYKTAAGEAKPIWQSWDQSKPETATVAREFGFASLVAGENEEARDFGRFLVEKGASLATPDDQPLVSAVLFRAADYRITHQAGALGALRTALIARSATPGVDMTTVISWELLYTSDWNTGGLADVEADARNAAAYFSRNLSLRSRQRDAEIHSAASVFVGGRNRLTPGKNSYYETMADVHDRIVADINAATSPAAASALWPEKWRAEAWTMAMWSYLNSTYEQVSSLTKTRIDPRPLTQPKFAQYPEDPTTASVPVCEGSFDGPRLQYPASKEYQGLVGGVIAHLETGVDGHVTKAEVLAAVPTEGFAEKVVATLSTWTFKPAKNATGCRLNSRNHVFRVVAVIG